MRTWPPRSRCWARSGTGSSCTPWPPGPARFGELHAAIGSISSKTLADRLRELAGADLVTHAQLPPGPATYTLASDGHALLPALERIRHWWQQRAPAAATDRPR